MGIVELNLILGVEIGIHEFAYCYTPVRVNNDYRKCYFHSKQKNREIVQFLLDAGKGVDDVMVWILSL